MGIELCLALQWPHWLVAISKICIEGSWKLETWLTDRLHDMPTSIDSCWRAASLKFTPITAKSPAPLTFRQPHSMPEETGRKEDPSIPPLCNLVSKCWTHHTRPETRNAPCRWAMALPSPGSCLWPLWQAESALGQSESLHLPQPLFSQHRKSHLTTTGREEVPCGVPGLVSDESYLLLHSIIRENPGSLMFI